VYALVCALVSAGLGVAVVPEMVAATAATPVSARLLEPGDLRRTISVVHRADVTVPAADAFRALLRGAFGRAGRHRLSGRPESPGRRDDIL
jgi:DNA-binding transcriptional LysR family regulator